MKSSMLFLAMLGFGLAGLARADEGVPAASAEPRPPAQGLAVGIGYPDLRLRYGFGNGLDTELKWAFSPGVQVYSGRLYYTPFHLGGLGLLAGAEAGWLTFNQVSSLQGSGYEAGAFLGLEYSFARHLRLNVDAGPTWVQVSADGSSFGTSDMVLNTALYWFFF